MANPLRQLQLLLWKNYLLRRRNKIRMAMEFLWPLVLFMILVWVRTRGLKDNKATCHLIPKALPSVGGFEFFQNFLCTLNNTCYQNYVEDNPHPWSNSQFNRMVKAVTPILEYLSANSDEARSTVSNMWSRLNLFAIIAEGLKTREQFQHLGMKKISDFITPENRVKFLERAVRWVSIEATDLGKALDTEFNMTHVDANFLSDVFNDFRSGECTKIGNHSAINATPELLSVCKLGPRKNFMLLYLFAGLMDGDIVREFRSLVTLDRLRSGTEGLNLTIEPPNENVITAFTNLGRIFAIEGGNLSQLIVSGKTLTAADTAQIFYFMCGSPGGHSNDSIFGLQPDSPNRYDSLRDNLKDWNNDRRTYFQLDPELSPTCNALILRLEETQLVALIWRQIKPFLRGSIMYAPNSTTAQDIMARVDAQFEKIRDTEKYFKSVVLIIHTIRLWLRNNSVEISTLKVVLSDVEVLEDMLILIGIGPEVPDRNRLFAAAKFISEIELDSVLERLDFYAEVLSDLLHCFKYNRTVPFSTEDEAVSAALPLLAANNLWAVVIFPEDMDANTTHLKYTIRMDSDKVDSTRFIRDRLTSKSPRRRPIFDLKYLTHGFVYIQELIEQAWIEKLTNVSANPFGLYLQQFPYPCHIYDQFIRAISRTFPLFMVLSWVYASSMIIKSIVLEKEKHLREVMKVMGFSNGVIWGGWFIDSFVVMFLSATVLSVILKWGKVIEHADFTLIWIFMISFTISVICFSFLVSTFFNRANSAAAAGGILFFVTYLPYNFLLIWEERLTWYHIMTGCLFSNVAFGFGCTYFARLEEDGVGAQWDRITLRTLAEDDFNLGYSICMLWFDSLLYLLLTLYWEAVSPGATGTPKPWYFIFQKSTWCGEKEKRKNVTAEDRQPLSNTDPSELEEDPPGLECGVWVNSLSKTYSNGKIAVQDLNLKFFEDQITSFLGHNGAGKTTTISMLTGLFPPTSGTAYIYGADIRTDMDEIRKNLGICPQFNVLFDRLTVEDHLRFFAGVKDKSKEFIEAEIDRMLGDLGIPEKRHEFPNNLSGGMKRKLSVAIAFVGGSKTVFLDEPTSGVDPFSRRSIWDLLIKYKKGRTIILTTHFMDEADLLGDRIAIVSRGKLKTCGSSLFLKSKFGKGYFLRLVRRNNPNMPFDYSQKQEEDIQQTEAHRNTAELSTFVRQRVPRAKFVDDVGIEVTFALPYEEGSLFVQLLNDLEENLDQLHISSFGISDTPLEDVFLRITADDLKPSESGRAIQRKSVFCSCFVCSNREETEPDSKDNEMLTKDLNGIGNGTVPAREAFSPLPMTNDDDNSRVADFEVSDTVSIPGIEEEMKLKKQRFLEIYQISTIILKRMRNAKRNLKALFFEVILPIVFIAFTLAFTLILPNPMDEKLQHVNPWVYPDPRYIFISNSAYNGSQSPLDSSAQQFQSKVQPLWDEIIGPFGIGTACIDSKIAAEYCSSQWSNASVEAFEESRHHHTNLQLPICSCDSGSQLCNHDTDKNPPPSIITPVKDFVLDVSKYSVPEWLEKTYKIYDGHRYGGYEIQQTQSSLNLSHVLQLIASIILPNTDNTSAPTEEEYSDQVKIWYENRGWLSSIAYVNAYSNALLRANLPDEFSDRKSEFGITLSTHPLNLTDAQRSKESLKVSALGVVHAICVIFALSFIPASFTVYLIEERYIGGKHLHMVSGVKPMTYWSANFIYDMMKYLVSAILTVLLFVAFNAKAYTSQDSIGAFIILIVLYGWATIPLMYPASHLFDIPSTAFVTLACANLFIGVITTVSTFVLEQFGDPELDEIGSILKELFLIFPQYCLGRGLLELVRLDIFAVAQSSLKMQFTEPNRFLWKFLGKLHFCLFAEGILLFFLNLAFDYRRVVSRVFRRHQTDPPVLSNEDEDVAEERSRVLQNYNPTTPLHAENLSKVYRSKPTPAVSALCFEVNVGECFGLLGINGAGKTSTFKMLTGDVKISSGKAVLCGYDVDINRDRARKHFGYCPQEDGFDGLLNAYEVLELYGKLRGMTQERSTECGKVLIKLLGLAPYAHRRSGTYSGGNKRKLSTAIALIGNPDVIFLDEPTSGMDPGARRQLWKVILALVHSKKSIVLTSHSMEECEALCTRLGIMVNGRFVCLGSIQHLKNRFGQGYVLTVKLADSSETEFLEYMRQELPNAVMEESHLKQIKFSVKQAGIKLSLVFNTLQNAKDGRMIEDYSLSQTSLDDIFVRFASHQNDL